MICTLSTDLFFAFYLMISESLAATAELILSTNPDSNISIKKKKNWH